MNANRFKKIAVTGILVLFIVSIIFLATILPDLISNNRVKPLDNNDETEQISKRVVIITDDMSVKTRYNGVMNLKSKFDDYNNIEVLIFDSYGESDKQSFYLSNALNMQCDAVVIYPVELDFIMAEVDLLHSNSIPVIAVGDYDTNPSYLSVGFGLETTGKLQAQNTYAAIANSEIAVFTSSRTSDYAAAVLKGFTAEIANRPDIKIKRVFYSSGVSKSVLTERIVTAMEYSAIVVQDATSLQMITDTLYAKGYTGIIAGITSDSDMLAYVLEHENMSVIFQDSEQESSIVFHEVLSSFDEIDNNRFVEVHQNIINTYNIHDFLSE